MPTYPQNETRLSKLEKLSCEACLLDIERYYDEMADVIDYNYRLLSTDNDHRHKGSKQLLQPGRVVVVNDAVSVVLFPTKRFAISRSLNRNYSTTDGDLLSLFALVQFKQPLPGH